MQAQVTLDEAGRVLRSDQAHATRRVRALYRTGGTTEIAWTALATSGRGFSDAAAGFQQARVVLGSDAAGVARARDRVDVAVTASAEVQDLRRRRADLEDEAALRHRDAEAALAAGRALLAASGTALAEAVERERLEAERAALEAALAEAAARAAAEQAAAQALAQGSAGAAGPGGGSVGAGTVGRDLQAVLDRAAAGASSPTAAAAIRAAGSRLGLPYTWGATGPGTFDCSGLTMWAYAQAGARIPRTSRQQYADLPRVPVSELLPGDLVFYAHGIPRLDPPRVRLVGRRARPHGPEDRRRGQDQPGPGAAVVRRRPRPRLSPAAAASCAARVRPPVGSALQWSGGSPASARRPARRPVGRSGGAWWTASDPARSWRAGTACRSRWPPTR